MIGILIALIVLSIILALIFFLRPEVTVGAGWKIVAFIGLCVLPALCIAGGMGTHMVRSEKREFCTSCHAMEPYGKSLYLDDTAALPAQHFQNHRVPADEACYACHADYTIYGPLKDKMRGLTRIYMQYISSPPKTITIPGGYSNLQCLHCHGGARNFTENPVHSAMMDSLTSNQMSCLTSGCHDSIHNIDKLEGAKFWRPGQ